ncbi:MAG: amidophosphoribosyltransferase, partial [Zetaproteobacteria bacterium]
MRPDKLTHACGVFGIFDHEEAANITYLGLYALQHRGQASAGIVATDGRTFTSHRGMGRVAQVFRPRDIERLRGRLAIGHVRYPTTGETDLRNVQPFTFEFQGGGIALCHNGNLTNARALRRRLEAEGSIFQSTSDTEVLMHLIAKSEAASIEERLAHAASQAKGAYALLVLTADKLIGLKDPFGVRPLALGRLGEAWVLASETCAFDLIGARFVRELEPGEMVVISDAGVESLHPFARSEHRFCVFEHIYFARPDSTVDGTNVYQARIAIGMQLAKEAPAEAEIVVPVPDSGVPAAIGYARASGLPFEMGLIRNHY